MENKNRVEELLAEVIIRQDGMVEELKKLNLQTSENTRAIVKLADNLVMVVDHEKRIGKLERIVIK